MIVSKKEFVKLYIEAFQKMIGRALTETEIDGFGRDIEGLFDLVSSFARIVDAGKWEQLKQILKETKEHSDTMFCRGCVYGVEEGCDCWTKNGLKEWYGKLWKSLEKLERMVGEK